MRLLFVGDLHDQTDSVLAIEELAEGLEAPCVIQVGDFGYGWRRYQGLERHFATHPSGPKWYSCLGNHDNYSFWNQLPEIEGGFRQADERVFGAKRPAELVLEEKRILFFGGAESTDAQYRIEGVSWWKEETPSTAEFTALSDYLSEKGLPNVLVTHDGPTAHIRDMTCMLSNLEGNYTLKTVQRILDPHSPQDDKSLFWFFGHHHELKRTKAVPSFMKAFCCGLHGDLWVLDTDTGKTVSVQSQQMPHPTIAKRVLQELTEKT